MKEEKEKYKLIFQNKHSLPLEVISLIDKDNKEIYKFEKPFYLPNLKTICVDYFCQNKLDEISNKELIIDLPIFSNSPVKGANNPILIWLLPNATFGKVIKKIIYGG